MPTYVYRCQSCEHLFEVIQRITDDPIQACEECGGPVKKVFHPAGIVFKGSGFYVNDHGRKGNSVSSSPSGSSSPGSGSSSTD